MLSNMDIVDLCRTEMTKGIQKGKMCNTMNGEKDEIVKAIKIRQMCLQRCLADPECHAMNFGKRSNDEEAVCILAMTTCIVIDEADMTTIVFENMNTKKPPPTPQTFDLIPPPNRLPNRLVG